LGAGFVRLDGKVTIDRLRDVIQDAHLNLLVGAGTPSAYFGLLKDVETVLTEIEASTVITEEKQLARASVVAYFFRTVVGPNLELLEGSDGESVVSSYEDLLGMLYRILLRRRSSLLNKQLNIFTTNVDVTFELALERSRLEHNDGFTGKLEPVFDLANFGSLRFKQSPYYENISEIPTMNLHKLHGSVNWSASDETSEIGFDRNLEAVITAAAKLETATADLIEVKGDDLETKRVLDAVAGKVPSAAVADFLAAYDKLAIVNPTKQKFETTVLNETYYEQIRVFSNSLEKQNSVLLVHGFSFRDEHLKKIVIRAARSNPRLEVIVFCYDQASETAIRIELPEHDVKNGNITFVTPPVGEDKKPVYLLDVDELVKRWLAPLVPAPEPRPDRVVDVNIKVDGAEHVKD